MVAYNGDLYILILNAAFFEKCCTVSLWH